MSEEKTALEKAPVPIGGLLTSLEEGWRFSQMAAQSELVPKHFRGKPHDILVAISMGAELQLGPAQALQSIAVINGRPGLYGDGLLAVVMASPLYVDHEEFFEVGGRRSDGLVAADWQRDDTAAVCIFLRKGKAQPVTRRFTVAQARKAQLLAKDGPWQTYPDRMLAMRARSFAARDTFPDLLRGIRMVEELRDLPADDPIAIVPQVRRLSDPAPPPPPEAAPEEAPVTIGPARLVRVEIAEQLAVLDSGETLIVSEEDARALAAFVGQPQDVIFSCGLPHGPQAPWRVVAFALAEEAHDV